MQFWYTEEQTDDVRLSLRVRQTLHREETPFQTLDVVETDRFGRMLVLDGMVQTTERDEFVYHEMITHVAMVTHPAPRHVAIIGGGDGGAVREVLKHPQVERVTLIEIDERVTAVSRELLPSIGGALGDPRVELRFEDGVAHIAQSRERYDVVIVDSTEPVGAAIGLFTAEFYHNVAQALREDGIAVAQTESPYFNAELLRSAHQALATAFPITRTYLSAIPTYPSGLWSFTIGSKRHDPLQADASQLDSMETRYITSEIARAAFALPRFVKELLDTTTGVS